MKEFYKTYNLEAFLTDDEFVADVKSQKLDKIALFEYLQSSPEALKNAQNAFDMLQALSQTEHGIDTETLWNRIQADNAKSEPIENTNVKILPILKWISGIAASVLIIFLVQKNWVAGDQNFNLSVNYGKEEVHTLPDGSTVYMNSGSKLYYQPSTFIKDRIIHLDGEAFFSVQKGEKFEVVTPQGLVEVLGTTFNVMSRDDKLIVECKSGKVRVSNAAGDLSQILIPNQAVQFDDGLISDAEPTRKSDWRNKKLEYAGASAIFVIDDLKRQFDLDIKFEDNKKVPKFSGEIPLTDADTAIKAFTWPLRLNYTIEGKNVNIF